MKKKVSEQEENTAPSVACSKFYQPISEFKAYPAACKADTESLLCKLHWNAIGFLGRREGMSAKEKLSWEVGEILKLTENPQQK